MQLVFGYGVFSGSTPSNALIEIGKRLIHHLNNQIDRNFHPESGGYPAITRLLISLNGLCEPNQVGRTDGGLEAAFYTKFLETLKTNYLDVATKHPEFAKDLLPEQVTYDPAKNELIYQDVARKITTLALSHEETKNS